MRSHAAPSSPSDPVFIVGYMHSGTSMLQRALGAHSAVYSTRGETKFFDFLPEIERRFPRVDADLQELAAFCVELVHAGYRLEHHPPAEVSWPELGPADLDAIRGRLEVRDHAHVFAAVMDRLTEVAGKQCWLEKTPTHVFSIAKIAAAVPRARFVEIVRDVRDVLASKKTRRETVWTTKRFDDSQRAWKHLEKAYDPLWDALSWKSAIRAGMTAARDVPARIVRVRYEDLVRAPEAEIARICAFLGMAFEPAMLDVPRGQPADEGALAQRGRGISAESVGRWHTALPAPERALIQAVTADELRALGYEHEATPLVTGLRTVPLLASSGIELLQRLERRRRMGGNAFLRVTMSNYVRRAAQLLRARA